MGRPGLAMRFNRHDPLVTRHHSTHRRIGIGQQLIVPRGVNGQFCIMFVGHELDVPVMCWMSTPVVSCVVVVYGLFQRQTVTDVAAVDNNILVEFLTYSIQQGSESTVSGRRIRPQGMLNLLA